MSVLSAILPLAVAASALCQSAFTEMETTCAAGQALEIANQKHMEISCKIEFFQYSHSSPVMQGCYSISATWKKGKAILIFAPAGKKERKFSPGSDFIARLEEICQKHNVASWNGHHESQPECLDGNSFTLSIFYEGLRQHTSCQNCAPEGFADFIEDLRNLCSPYFDFI